MSDINRSLQVSKGENKMFHVSTNEFTLSKRKKRDIPSCGSSSSMDRLPDEVIIFILSNSKIDDVEAARNNAYLTKALTECIMELQQCRNVVDKFMIRCFKSHGQYDNNVTDDAICDWIRFCIRKKVRVLELAASHCIPTVVSSYHFKTQRADPFWAAGAFYYFQNPDEIKLPLYCYDFPSLEKFLSISREMDRVVGSCAPAFASLASLTLANFNLTNEMMEYLLANCQCLEQLSLKDVAYLSRLRIVSSPSLKSLSIGRCWDLKNVRIISAANLVSFEYTGHPLYLWQGTEFCFDNVPLLSKLTGDITYLVSFIADKHLHEVYSNQMEKMALYLPRRQVSMTLLL
ncbi:OLC1v1001677C2 [Oldenlandia corymbosa var. corymbosa]|uniref:OLC1v1001677C2 n=1 Tax=Oldenlandia corymbosa var. corymbosa TaxID=529605 RepID=A0AAV1D8M0_OLDCO|nr:OLC1v1001677C2 [Oldenlandia corymbosa var. corymbosa]